MEEAVTVNMQTTTPNANMRSSAVSAYGQSARRIETPNDVDAMVLKTAAEKLLNVQQTPEEDIFEEVLLYNQLIWTVIQSEMTEAHPLPVEIKANLISLSLFIDNQTDKAIGARDPKMLDSLININRNIAAGLMHRG